MSQYCRNFHPNFPIYDFVFVFVVDEAVLQILFRDVVVVVVGGGAVVNSSSSVLLSLSSSYLRAQHLQ